MASKNQTPRMFETSLERKANRSFKLHARELKERELNQSFKAVRSGRINTIDEDDYSDIDEMMEEDD